MQKNKILIEEREDGTLIGLSRDGVDPYVKKVGLTWEQTIAQLPFLKGMTDIAEEQWKLSPKNPSYTAPPKTEVKKVEPAKKAVPAKKGAKTKPEQPALTVSDEKNPVTSVTETAAIKPSESVVEPVKVEEPKILAPIASVAEAKANEPGQVAANLSKDSKVEPVTLTPCGTPPEGTPDNLINSPASGFPLTPAEEVRDHVGQTKTRVSADAFQYKLKDGRGPFADVQLAMDALGIDKATRPTHNRYDRLSKKLQEEIIREVK